MSDDRLELMRPLLDRYRRRFSVLELGSGGGTVSCGIASGYDSVVAAVEKDPETYPPYVTSGRLLYMRKELTVDDIVMLSECERFDVVIALNFIHWFKEWRKVIEALLHLGDWVYLQLPPLWETTAPNASALPEMHDMVQALSGDLLGETVQFPGHAPRPLYLCRGILTALTRNIFDSHLHSARTIFASDFTKRIGTIKGKPPKDWIPAINLATFIKLQGIVPTKADLLGMLRTFELPRERHGDVNLHNFIIDGKQLYLVDGFEGWEFDDRANLDSVIARIGAL